MIVLDASIVVELLTNGPLAGSLRRDMAGRNDSFLVPHLLDISDERPPKPIGRTARRCRRYRAVLGIAAQFHGVVLFTP